ncbi:MAG TPA: redox-sensitive transcriptional activator SoxR [Arenimonas sp.]|nr:redox-sensitive transcriptional activator SoxR [Arenimonas sp.]
MPTTITRSRAATGPLTIGELAARIGVAVTALRFYEQRGLISSSRSAGNQRRYPRDTLRRVAFILAGQQVGIPLQRIGEALQSLPAQRVPNRADWTQLSRGWRAELEQRIDQLEQLRDKLDSCIGCGCLSLRACRLYNRDDVLAAEGSGPRRYLNVAR